MPRDVGDNHTRRAQPEILQAGTVLVQGGANEIGGGTAKVHLQEVADSRGRADRKVIQCGDSVLPDPRLKPVAREHETMFNIRGEHE
jgi:hypothetical protein